MLFLHYIKENLAPYSINITKTVSGTVTNIMEWDRFYALFEHEDIPNKILPILF
jgi:hypothetical protein